jgi:hypothetical protein
MIRQFAVIALFCVSTFGVVYPQEPTRSPNKLRTPINRALIEEFSFELKDFKMDHQTQANNLNISVSYRYMVNIKNGDYPDFRSLAKDIETALTKYPNEDDYWEIVNKNLTALLLKKYPALSSITIELKADPSSLIPYTRSSRVTRTSRQ